MFNVQIISFYAKSIIFNANIISFNEKSIIFNEESTFIVRPIVRAKYVARGTYIYSGYIRHTPKSIYHCFAVNFISLRSR